MRAARAAGAVTSAAAPARIEGEDGAQTVLLTASLRSTRPLIPRFARIPPITRQTFFEIMASFPSGVAIVSGTMVQVFRLDSSITAADWSGAGLPAHS